MASQVTNYQCPACTGPLHFAGASGKLECDYCGQSYTVEEIEALYAHQEQQAAQAFQAEEEREEDQAASGGGESWDASGIGTDWGAEGEGMRAYTCPSCGAELICDSTTAASSCPYCGNPTVVPGQFSGALRPDFVIPFHLAKEQAVEALRKHYKGKPLLPKAFRDENHIREIQGIYVPFWLFDGEARGDAHYSATRTHVRRTASEEITRTDHFRVYRAGSITFEKVPADASSKMPDDLMDSLEPYDYEDLKPFSTAFLPGFLADKFDVTAEQSQERVDLRCENTLEAALRDTVRGYGTCVRTGGSASIRRGKVHYALMPAWILHTKWNGQDYLFAMNGQTGKLVGDLPMSWGRFWAVFAAISVPLTILGSVVSLLAVG